MYLGEDGRKFFNIQIPIFNIYLFLNVVQHRKLLFPSNQCSKGAVYTDMTFKEIATYNVSYELKYL